MKLAPWPVSLRSKSAQKYQRQHAAETEIQLHLRNKSCTDDNFEETVTRPTTIKGRLCSVGTFLLYINTLVQCSVQ